MPRVNGTRLVLAESGHWITVTNGTRRWVGARYRRQGVLAPAIPQQFPLDTPHFRVARMRNLGVPLASLFVSCTDGRRVLCAVRQNSSARRILILRNHQVVNVIEDADDPRIFIHNNTYWVLNNNFYRMTMVELFRNGSFGREIRVPIMQGKNLVPLSWSDEHFFLLDIKDKALWPAALVDRQTVLIKRPLDLLVRRREPMQCPMPAGCSPRGGSQGVHLNPRDDYAYGAGHCTAYRRVRRAREVSHWAYWWALNLPKRELEIDGLCGPRHKLVDPSAIYPLQQIRRGRNGSSKPRLVWIMQTTEADEEWNKIREQRYYNEVYRAEMDLRPVPTPPPPPARPPAEAWRSLLVSWFQHKMLRLQ